jgi:hypothetical protein
MRRRRFTLRPGDQDDQQEGRAGGQNRDAGRDEEVSLIRQNSGRRRPPRSKSRRDAVAEEEQRGSDCHHRDQHDGADVGSRVREGEWSHLAGNRPLRHATGSACGRRLLAANARCRSLRRPARLRCPARLARRPFPLSVGRSSRSVRCSNRGRRLGHRRLRRLRLGRHRRLRGWLREWLWLWRGWFRVRPKPCSRGRSAHQEAGEHQRDQERRVKFEWRPQVRHRLHLVTSTNGCKTPSTGRRILDAWRSR